MKFKNITIIGVGLIGGSIGLALKKKKLASKVKGVTAHKRTLNAALRLGAIDKGTLDVCESVKDADLVIIAMPADKVVSTVKKIRKFLKPGAVVADVASTKKHIVSGAEAALCGKFAFVGCHPMAGSERRGIDAASHGLFGGSVCVITKTGKTDKSALRALALFWGRMGCRVSIMPPDLHDRLVSEISHLPHIAAAALCLTPAGNALPFAATGFEDMTRIASGDPSVWIPIIGSNKKNISASIYSYIGVLKGFATAINGSDNRRLSVLLKSAKSRRDRLYRRA